jgi:hypothetical protein
MIEIMNWMIVEKIAKNNYNEGALLSMPLWSVTYYTLSDCKASKDIRAKTGSEAEQIAREKDETFDRLISVSIVLEAR